jgi:hypothetical protein
VDSAVNGMAPAIYTSVHRLRSGRVCVEYRAGDVWGAVMFDSRGVYRDATRQTESCRTSGFVDDIGRLPRGVYAAARAALLEAK